MTIKLLLGSLLLNAASVAGATTNLPDVAFSGDIMVDYDNYASNFLESAETGDAGAELRRFRLKAEADVSTHWEAKLSVDLADDLSIKDAWFKYRGWHSADITLGLQKEPFGLEQLTSSANLVLIERSISSEAIAPGRAHGIKLSDIRGNISWQVGYFLNDSAEKDHALSGKLSWTPYQTDDSLLHIGTSLSQRNYKGAAFRINENPQVHSADSLIEGDKFNADRASLAGVEFLWQRKGFMALGEWQQMRVTAESGDTYQYSGGYYQMSYLFSGENRKYKNGHLSGVSRKTDWELTTGISRFNLGQENSHATVLAVGVNYYPDKHLKLMANVLRGEYVEDGRQADTGAALSLRAQFSF